MRLELRAAIDAVFIFAVMMSTVGCSNAEDPQNLEPSLIIMEATGITRGEATISARVERHGTGSLSAVRFMYREGDDGRFLETENIVPENDVASMQLTGLRAGMSYTYYAVGTTGNASVESEQMTFTTERNDPPALTGVRTLSTGPVGVIVEFEITDDGGEQLDEAGCELLEVSTGAKTRLYLPAAELTTGRHRLSVRPLNVNTEYIITSFASTRMGETMGEPLGYTTLDAVVLGEPGVLASIFGSTVKLGSLVIAGPMNGDDFHFLRSLLGVPALPGEDAIASELSEIDLSDVTIMEGGATYDGARYCVKDVVTTGLFAECRSLRRLVLPTSATALERDALMNCESLSEISIPANVSTVIPSAGCDVLECIAVSEANGNYSSHEGVLFNSDKTEILWFPKGKADAFTLPPSVTEIAQNAFKDTHIRTLIIPETVKSIARGAFAGAEIEEIVLPDAMTNISESMFQNCSSLRSVHLGKSTNFIGNYVFDGCPLEHLYVTAVNPPYVSPNAFTNRTYDLLKTCTLHVPAVSKSRYRNHDKWGKFEKITQDD